MLTAACPFHLRFCRPRLRCHRGINPVSSAASIRIEDDVSRLPRLDLLCESNSHTRADRSSDTRSVVMAVAPRRELVRARGCRDRRSVGRVSSASSAGWASPVITSNPRSPMGRRHHFHALIHQLERVCITQSSAALHASLDPSMAKSNSLESALVADHQLHISAGDYPPNVALLRSCTRWRRSAAARDIPSCLKPCGPGGPKKGMA